MKKFFITLMCIIMVVCFMPTVAFAAGEPGLTGEVVGLSGQVTVKPGEGVITQVLYESPITLRWYPADEGNGRIVDGWWLGVKVSAPSGKNETAQYAFESQTFKPYVEDGEGYITLWGLVTPDILDEWGAVSNWISYTWNFDWDGNSSVDQTVKMFVKINQCTLLNSESQQIYPIASIGNKNYKSLSAAINAATNGQTVTLLKDVELTGTQNITKNLIIDLNGHDITGNGARVFNVQSGTLTLDGTGIISSNNENNNEEFSTDSSVIRVGNNSGTSDASAGLNIGEGVTISSPYCYGVTVFGSKTKETVVVNGKIKVTGEAGALSGNGSAGYGNTSITINPTAEITATKDAAIYHPQSGILTINGGTIVGTSAIECKAGETTVVVSGNPTITATGVVDDSAANNNGTSSRGYAVAVVENAAYAGGAKVTIESGTYTGAIGIRKDNEVAEEKKGSITISGGTFSSDVSAYVADGKYEYAMRNGTYIVQGAEKPAFTTGNYWSDSVGNVYTEMYSAPYVPSTPTDNVTNSGSSAADNATTSADLSGSTSTSNGTTTAEVDKTTADKIVDKAVENKSTEVVIDATANTTTAASSTTIAQVTIPTETLGAIAEKTEADVTIKTDVAEVKMDNAAAAAVSEQAEGDTVQIIAEKVAEDTEKVEFELKVVCSDGKVISDFNGGNIAVTVALPKAMAEKKVVCVYIDDNGHMSKVEGQKNADGTYTFVTGHFSTYAILAEEEADAAIAEQTEAIKNIDITLSTKVAKTKAGKKGIKLTWKADTDKQLDGVEVFRSVKSKSGYSKIYTTKKAKNAGYYINTKGLKANTKYYYKIRGFVMVDGQKVYTDWSNKGIRTFK